MNKVPAFLFKDELSSGMVILSNQSQLDKKIKLIRLLRRQLKQQLIWTRLGNMEKANSWFHKIESTIVKLDSVSKGILRDTSDRESRIRQLIIQKIYDECVVLNNAIQSDYLDEQRMLGREITEMQLDRELQRLEISGSGS